jgi:hypothetical protein
MRVVTQERGGQEIKGILLISSLLPSLVHRFSGVPPVGEDRQEGRGQEAKRNSPDLLPPAPPLALFSGVLQLAKTGWREEETKKNSPDLLPPAIPRELLVSCPRSEPQP